MLRVLLPPGYDDETNQIRRYPVLYLNDGQKARTRSNP
jgi:predicted alpha/beta superfamily hydrolase